MKFSGKKLFFFGYSLFVLLMVNAGCYGASSSLSSKAVKTKTVSQSSWSSSTSSTPAPTHAVSTASSGSSLSSESVGRKKQTIVDPVAGLRPQVCFLFMILNAYEAYYNQGIGEEELKVNFRPTVEDIPEYAISKEDRTILLSHDYVSNYFLKRISGLFLSDYADSLSASDDAIYEILKKYRQGNFLGSYATPENVSHTNKLINDGKRSEYFYEIARIRSQDREFIDDIRQVFKHFVLDLVDLRVAQALGVRMEQDGFFKVTPQQDARKVELLQSERNKYIALLEAREKEKIEADSKKREELRRKVEQELACRKREHQEKERKKKEEQEAQEQELLAKQLQERKEREAQEAAKKEEERLRLLHEEQERERVRLEQEQKAEQERIGKERASIPTDEQDWLTKQIDLFIVLLKAYEDSEDSSYNVPGKLIIAWKDYFRKEVIVGLPKDKMSPEYRSVLLHDYASHLFVERIATRSGTKIKNIFKKYSRDKRTKLLGLPVTPENISYVNKLLNDNKAGFCAQIAHSNGVDREFIDDMEAVYKYYVLDLVDLRAIRDLDKGVLSNALKNETERAQAELAKKQYIAKLEALEQEKKERKRQERKEAAKREEERLQCLREEQEREQERLKQEHLRVAEQQRVEQERVENERKLAEEKRQQEERLQEEERKKKDEEQQRKLKEKLEAEKSAQKQERLRKKAEFDRQAQELREREEQRRKEQSQRDKELLRKKQEDLEAQKRLAEQQAERERLERERLQEEERKKKDEEQQRKLKEKQEARKQARQQECLRKKAEFLKQQEELGQLELIRREEQSLRDKELLRNRRQEKKLDALAQDVAQQALQEAQGALREERRSQRINRRPEPVSIDEWFKQRQLQDEHMRSEAENKRQHEEYLQRERDRRAQEEQQRFEEERIRQELETHRQHQLFLQEQEYKKQERATQQADLEQRETERQDAAQRGGQLLDYLKQQQERAEAERQKSESAAMQTNSIPASKSAFDLLREQNTTFEQDFEFCWKYDGNEKFKELKEKYGKSWLVGQVAKKWILQAVRQGNTKALQDVVSRSYQLGGGAFWVIDVNFADEEYGETLLSIAVKGGDKNYVLLTELYKYGGFSFVKAIHEPNPRDGKTPLQIAYELENDPSRCIATLLQGISGYYGGYK